MTDNSIPRASIEETTLPNEPATDKAFKNLSDGNEYRVRIVPKETDASGASLYLRAYTISVTRLKDGKEVERNQDGTVDIVASTTLTIDQETWTNGNTPESTFQRVIEQMIHRASETSATKSSVDSFMASWGAAPVNEAK